MLWVPIKISWLIPIKPTVAEDFVPEEKDGDRSGRREVITVAWPRQGDSPAAGTLKPAGNPGKATGASVSSVKSG